MTVQITITDPHLMERADLMRYVDVLAGLAGYGPHQEEPTEPVSRPKPAADPATDEPPPPAPLIPHYGTGVAEMTAETPEIATDVPPPPPPAIPSVDSRGLPWDGRVHASTKAVNADGTWRNRRGVDPEVLAAVEAELRAAMAAPAPEPADAPSPSAPDAAQAFGAVPPPPVAPAAAVPVTFPQLVRAASERVAQGLLTQAAIVQACQSAGVPALPALAVRPDLVPTVAAALGIEVTQ